MQLNTYLTFDTNCREAFEFYRTVFGGEYAEIHTFDEAPPDMGVPEHERGLIMHVSLPIGSSVLMGSDSSSTQGPPPVVGSNFFRFRQSRQQGGSRPAVCRTVGRRQNHRAAG